MVELTVKALREAMQEWNTKEKIDGYNRYFVIFPDGSCHILIHIKHGEKKKQRFGSVEEMYSFIKSKIKPIVVISEVDTENIANKIKKEIEPYVQNLIDKAIKDFVALC